MASSLGCPAWDASADPEATLAIYMGGAAGGELSRRLIAAGRSPLTPVLAVENVGRSGSRIARGTLDRLGELAAAADGGPVLIVVGQVAALADVARPPAALQDLPPSDAADQVPLHAITAA